MTINAHPELPEFDYIRPASLVEASQFLAQHPGDARPLLGGTDILVRMRDGIWRDRYLVDVKKLDGTSEIIFNEGLGLTIGAAVNMNQVITHPQVQAHYPLLAQACRRVASYQLRSRATIVGNICNASPAGDTIGACMLLDGILNIHGINGLRQEFLAGFFLGPGKTILSPGDIVTSIHFPLPPAGWAGTYLKLGRNTWSDLAIVGVTVFGGPHPASASGYRFRIALASVAPVPLIAAAAEDYLSCTPPTPENFAHAAHLAAEACNPIDDVRGSARYRKAMAQKLTEKALQKTWLEVTR
ncbi:MAG: xanthine dehydrogenase family protein subunit M [Anaerolineales bacterium]|nr:xanthine dehydrogenase family protein subunit M [Anaerolineales bacterium]